MGVLVLRGHHALDSSQHKRQESCKRANEGQLTDTEEDGYPSEDAEDDEQDLEAGLHYGSISVSLIVERGDEKSPRIGTECVAGVSERFSKRG